MLAEITTEEWRIILAIWGFLFVTVVPVLIVAWYVEPKIQEAFRQQAWQRSLRRIQNLVVTISVDTSGFTAAMRRAAQSMAEFDAAWKGIQRVLRSTSTSVHDLATPPPPLSPYDWAADVLDSEDEDR